MRPLEPSVSVVIPTYQRREWVRRAVSSVLGQSFQDFELIVVDDGSTDGTGEALSGVDGRLRYEWQPNRGVSAARNVGIRLARGETVAFLDSDDRWLPDHLAVVTEVLTRNPEVVLCSTCPHGFIQGRQAVRDAKPVDPLPLLFVENVVGIPSGVAARREALLAAGSFDERLRVMEGRELYLRLAVLGPFVLLRRRTIIYQMTSGSLTHRSGRDGDYFAALQIVGETGRAIAEAAGDEGTELRSRAVGMAAYVGALRALSRDDDAALRIALQDACARLPELSREPELVARRIVLMSSARAARLRRMASVASLWPDPATDTGLYLRLRALALALRAGKPRAAVRLVRGWPLAATPGFAVRAAPLFARQARRSIQGRVYRGRESIEIDARGSHEGPMRSAEHEDQALGDAG